MRIVQFCQVDILFDRNLIKSWRIMAEREIFDKLIQKCKCLILLKRCLLPFGKKGQETTNKIGTVMISN